MEVAFHFTLNEGEGVDADAAPTIKCLLTKIL